MTMPKRAAQKVCSSGIMTLPPFAKLIKDSFSVSRVLHLQREREPLGSS